MLFPAPLKLQGWALLWLKTANSCKLCPWPQWYNWDWRHWPIRKSLLSFWRYYDMSLKPQGGDWRSSRGSAEELKNETKPEKTKSIDEFCWQILSQGQSQFKTSLMGALYLHEQLLCQSLLFCFLYAKDPQTTLVVTSATFKQVSSTPASHKRPLLDVSSDSQPPESRM